MLNLDENKFACKKNHEGKSSPRYSDPKNAWNGRSEESSRTTFFRILSSKIKRISRDNTEAHFSLPRNVGTNDFMKDTGEFHEVESYKSERMSLVSSQLAMIRSSRFILRTGLQEHVLVTNFSTFDSSRDNPQGIHSDDVQRNREAGPEAGRRKTG